MSRERFPGRTHPPGDPPYPPPQAHVVRPIDPGSQAEVELVAARMRKTLVEVLGEERGTAMYTMEWLVERVRFQLDPGASTARVFLAEAPDGHVSGHTIVRVDHDDEGNEIGLFSTTYVEPESRRAGVAEGLLLRGEAWMREQGLREAATYTSGTNARLIGLYRKHGYTLVEPGGEMVILKKPLAGQAAGTS